jgi:diacylglycerol kinase family enzyme
LALADRTGEALGRAGMAVDRLDVGPGLAPLDLVGAITGADAVAVAGGDGTVLSVAKACVATGVPIYHLPAGNENLFSREFGSSRDPARLLLALRRRKLAHCDVGTCAWLNAGGDQRNTPFPFLLMASIGPDASVVHRLHSSRKEAVGHYAYIRPICDELAAPALSRVRVWCDGRLAVSGRGMVVVANCKHYALGMNPCADADPQDGLLDVAFIPADTSIDAIAGLLRLRVRCPGADMVRDRGARVRLEMESGARVQVDGEAVEGVSDGDGWRTMELSATRGILPVLDAR